MVPVPDTRYADVRDQIASLGIRQGDDPILREQAQRLLLPDEADRAKRTLDELLDTIKRLKQVHRFTNGVGLAAPQVGHSVAIAVVRPVGEYPIRLINPRVVSASRKIERHYEGCLSFFDFRGLVPRPVSLVVESSDLRGRLSTKEYRGTVARLVAHEIDHLHGRLYTDLLGDTADLIDISDYRTRRWD